MTIWIKTHNNKSLNNNLNTLMTHIQLADQDVK